MNPINLLHNLVAIPSLSGQEAAAVAFLVEQMAALDLVAHVDGAGNAVGRRECPDENGRIQQQIVLLGHVDTVPGEIPVRIENGRLYGRGAVDAKGALATFVIAAATAPVAPGTCLVVIGAVEEEAATSRGARHAAAAYRPDLCIIGEPSGWDGITLGYKGRLLLDYHYGRPVSHSAGPQGGVAEGAVAWWQQIDAYASSFNKGVERFFDQLMPSLRHIRTQSDGLSEQVEATVALRLPPGFDAAAFTRQAQEWDTAAQVRSYAHEAAFQSSRHTPLARTFNQAIRGSGAVTRFKVKTGTSDMNVVAPQWRCPIVAYGPGDSSLDHTPEEHILLADYLRAIEVLVRVLAGMNSGTVNSQQSTVNFEP
jgi:[amino group carrier protein]-lysine/ornithine hydrolase